MNDEPRSARYALKLILCPLLLPFLVYFEEYLRKTFIQSYFQYGWIYYWAYVVIFILFGLFLASLRRIPDTFWKKAVGKWSVAVIILLHLAFILLPWFQIFWGIQTGSVMICSYIIIGYYIYLFFYAIKVRKNDRKTLS